MKSFDWKRFFKIFLKLIVIIIFMVILVNGLLLLNNHYEKESLRANFEIYHVYCYHIESDRYIRYDLKSHRKPSIKNILIPSSTFIIFYPRYNSSSEIRINSGYHIDVSKVLNPWIEKNFKVLTVKI